ncbi:MAG TPA: hypothetical protein VG406_15465 [Isosphaeraceae bacterium]|jgi:hypothetical protein|nr:hypothetical protein [Isosphaeraceae bacterium]
MPPILIEVGAGELADRTSILSLKVLHLAGPARGRAEAELARLRVAAHAAGVHGPAVAPIVADLAAVNAELWDVEDAIREHEARGDFGPEFVALARSVYVLNDKRAALKREIDLTLGGQSAEVKVYAVGFSRPGPCRRYPTAGTPR